LQKFKSYDQIKDDLKQMNLAIRSDMEITKELSTKLKEEMKIFENSNQNIKNILTDLEYLLHQVDTAEFFVKNNGYAF